MPQKHFTEYLVGFLWLSVAVAMFGSICERAPSASSATCVGDVCGTVSVVSVITDGSGTTYQLGLDLSGAATNIYTVYGEKGYSLGLPAAYQSDAPFGTNVGGIDPGVVAVMPTAAFDSWLTVGVTLGDSGGDLGSIGIDWNAWTQSSGLSCDDCAVFWMSPGSGPSGSAVIAQVTVTGEQSPMARAIGRLAASHLP